MIEPKGTNKDLYDQPGYQDFEVHDVRHGQFFADSNNQ